MKKSKVYTHTINISHIPEMVKLTKQVEQTRQPTRLEVNGKYVADLTPPPLKSRLPKGKILTKDDAIFKMIGIGRSGKSDISSNKHKYLAEAILSHSRKV